MTLCMPILDVAVCECVLIYNGFLLGAMVAVELDTMSCLIIGGSLDRYCHASVRLLRWVLT